MTDGDVVKSISVVFREFQSLPPFSVDLRLCGALKHEATDVTRTPAVYILTNRPYGTLYTGVTGDLPKRVWQHKQQMAQGFTGRYNLTRLAYYEVHTDMRAAIAREKQIKGGPRERKIGLIEQLNPAWRDLYPDILPSSKF